ncbi:MAG: hypothetical protein Q8Q48_03685 [Candidatus Staskawiczbacteria bacterium]|nr:hypothetical protein [Candidatus Staskawiczbacteria bacterium]
MTEELPTVGDLIARVRETDIPEADGLIKGLLESIYNVETFLNDALTAERTRFVISDLSVLIGSKLSVMVRINPQHYRAMVWRGHLFLDEVRQQAVGLGVDADVIEKCIHSGC